MYGETLSWRSCQRRNFRPQTSLERYSEQSRSPKASKMDLQMIIGCLIVSKKSKMRFDCYLLHFRPFLTSKSDLKIDQKSAWAHTLDSAIVWVALFHIKMKTVRKTSKKGSQNRVGKILVRVTWRPLWPKEDPRWTPEAPKWSSRPQNDLKMTPKWVQYESKMDWQSQQKVMSFSCVA